MSIEKTVVIIVEGEDAIKEVQKLNDQLADTQARLDAIEKDAGKGFDGAAKGAGKFKTAINAVGTALKAAGIGLVLAALVKITDVFKNSPQGARIISRALNTINIVMLELYHNAAVLGDLLSALFRGDFVAVGALSAAFKEQIGNALDLGEAYTDMEFAVKALDDSLILVTSRQLRIMEQNRVIADNDKLSAAERIEAANNIEEASQVLFTTRTIRFNKELEMLNTLDVLNAEQTTRKFELLAEIETAEEEHNARLAELLSIRRGIQRREATELFSDTELDKRREGYNQVEADTSIHLDNMDALWAGYYKQQERHSSEAANTRVNNAKTESDFMIDTMEATGQAMVTLSLLADKESKSGKALAAAAVLVSSAVAIINTWKQYTAMTAPGPWATAAAIAQTVVIGAATAAALKQIATSDSGSQTMSSGGGGSAPPAPSFNVVGASQSSSLEQTLLSQGVRVSQDTPIKSYVVASDVTTMQSLDRQVEANAGV